MSRVFLPWCLTACLLVAFFVGADRPPGRFPSLETRVVRIVDEDGRLRAVFGLSPESGTPSLSFFRGEELGMSMQFSEDEPSVVLHGADGSSVVIFTDPRIGPRVETRGSKGELTGLLPRR